MYLSTNRYRREPGFGSCLFVSFTLAISSSLIGTKVSESVDSLHLRGIFGQCHLQRLVPHAFELLDHVSVLARTLAHVHHEAASRYARGIQERHAAATDFEPRVNWTQLTLALF